MINLNAGQTQVGRKFGPHFDSQTWSGRTRIAVVPRNMYQLVKSVNHLTTLQVERENRDGQESRLT